MRRAVITGLGLISPLGVGVDAVWRRILSGESGVRRIEKIRTDDLACRIAAEVPRADGYAGGALAGDAAFDAAAFVEPKDQRKIDDFIIFAIAAAKMAMTDSGLVLSLEEERERAGVLIGSGIGGIPGIEEAAIALHEKGPRRVSPFFIPGRLINLASGNVSIELGLKGPNHAVVTACSSGAHAIGDAARMVMLGDADVMVAGGAEAAICRLGLAGFGAARALSTGFNDEPTRASRPYDKDRDGFVMGEGAGVVVVEEFEKAKARGARIYGEVVGYGMSGDAFHITAPADDGDGAYRSMKAALARAGRKIDYVNAHGTSTPKGDEIELRAVERLFGADAGSLVMSSTKSSIGHLLGAAGAVEAIFSLLAMRDGVAPPTLNLDNPSVATSIELCANRPVEREISAALSNSFGFGGTNASLVFAKV